MRIGESGEVIESEFSARGNLGLDSVQRDLAWPQRHCPSEAQSTVNVMQNEEENAKAVR